VNAVINHSYLCVFIDILRFVRPAKVNLTTFSFVRPAKVNLTTFNFVRPAKVNLTTFNFVRPAKVNLTTFNFVRPVKVSLTTFNFDYFLINTPKFNCQRPDTCHSAPDTHDHSPSSSAMFISCGSCMKTNFIPGQAKTEAQTPHTMKRCKKCQQEFYCSAECQQAHWAIHKLVCPALHACCPQ
jgi:hypothetical protein